MSAPLVSVIIPVYRGEQFVVQAVQSVLDQRYPNVEIIIVNDGSPDRSRDVLAPLLDRPNVRYVEQNNAGVAAARNAGLRLAKGEFIGLVDQDDLWYPDKLDLQVACLIRHEAVGLVHGDVIYINENGHPLPRDPHFPDNVTGRCFARLFIGNPVMTCSALFRRSVIDQVGGFDELIRFSDDYDLWLRIAAAGFEFAYIDRPVAKYRIHAANESKKTVEIIDYTIRVLRKALAEIPSCSGWVGRDRIQARFGNLFARQATAYWARGDRLRAGATLLRALRYSHTATLDHLDRSGVRARLSSRIRWIASQLKAKL